MVICEFVKMTKMKCRYFCGWWPFHHKLLSSCEISHYSITGSVSNDCFFYLYLLFKTISYDNTAFYIYS